MVNFSGRNFVAVLCTSYYSRIDIKVRDSACYIINNVAQLSEHVCSRIFILIPTILSMLYLASLYTLCIRILKLYNWLTKTICVIILESVIIFKCTFLLFFYLINDLNDLNDTHDYVQIFLILCNFVLNDLPMSLRYFLSLSKFFNNIWTYKNFNFYHDYFNYYDYFLKRKITIS